MDFYRIVLPLSFQAPPLKQTETNFSRAATAEITGEAQRNEIDKEAQKRRLMILAQLTAHYL